MSRTSYFHYFLIVLSPGYQEKSLVKLRKSLVKKPSGFPISVSPMMCHLPIRHNPWGHDAFRAQKNVFISLKIRRKRKELSKGKCVFILSHRNKKILRFLRIDGILPEIKIKSCGI